ncbi:hypothetical protein ACOSQ2_010453 [Xanthoceras sorbifolium]
MVVMGLRVIGSKRTEIGFNSLGNLLRDFIKFSIRATSLTTTKFAQLFFPSSSTPFSFNLFFNPFSIFTLCISLLFSHFSQLFIYIYFCLLAILFFCTFPHPFHIFNSTPLSHLTRTHFSFNCL